MNHGGGCEGSGRSKRRRARRGVWVLLLGGVCGLASGCGGTRSADLKTTHGAASGGAGRGGGAPPPVVVEGENTPVAELRANGDVIRVEDMVRPLRKELAAAARRLPPEAYRKLVHQKVLEEFRQQVQGLLVYQAASRRLNEQEKKYLDGLVDDAVRRRVNDEFAGRQSQYEASLVDKGLTTAEDRARIRRELVTMRYLHQTVNSRVIDPTRAELMHFFEEQKDTLASPERRKMSLIEAPFAGPTAGRRPLSRAAARKVLEQARAALNEGTDFATAAMTYSKEPHAERGGAWDWIGRDSVREHWAPAVEALFRMRPGEVSDIIEGPEAFFIVQCDGVEPAVEADFESIQPRLIQAYRDAQFNRLVQEKVKELQSQAIFVPQNLGRFLQAVVQACPQPAA